MKLILQSITKNKNSNDQIKYKRTALVKVILQQYFF